MNTNKKLSNFFKRFTSDLTNDQVVENIYIPQGGISTLRVKETVQPDKRMNYTDTFNHIHNELQTVKTK